MEMTILFPIGSFYPSTFGGPGEILYWHGVYLKKHNIDAVFVTTTAGILNQIETDTFINSPCGKVYYGNGGILKPKTIIQIFKQVKSADVIHLTSIFSPISILCFLYSRIFYRRKIIIWSVRGELNTKALKISSRKKKAFLFIYKIFGKKVTFASTSLKETNEIKKNFKNSIVQIPNSMPSPDKIERTNNQFRFLFLGRIHPIKNIDSLIEAIHLVKEMNNTSIFLDIAGKVDERDIAYLEKLKQLCVEYNLESHITFLGHTADFAKQKLIANAYFLILPSHTENFGNVIIESLNQGTPVIASENTPWQALENFNCGYWIENSAKSIAKTIVDSISLDKKDYEEMRSKAQQLAKKEYSIEQCMYSWVDVYKNLIEK